MRIGVTRSCVATPCAAWRQFCQKRCRTRHRELWPRVCFCGSKAFKRCRYRDKTFASSWHGHNNATGSTNAPASSSRPISAPPNGPASSASRRFHDASFLERLALEMGAKPIELLDW